MCGTYGMAGSMLRARLSSAILMLKCWQLSEQARARPTADNVQVLASSMKVPARGVAWSSKSGRAHLVAGMSPVRLVWWSRGEV